MDRLRVVIFLLLAALMGFRAISYIYILISEGLFFFVILGMGTSVIATFVLLVAALQWSSSFTGYLVRVYAICLGILAIGEA